MPAQALSKNPPNEKQVALASDEVTAMADRKGLFLWYADAVQFELLTDEQLGQLIRGLLKYSEYHDLPEFKDPVVRLAFSFMAARDDRDSEKYEEMCERRRIAGKKGGRPKKANAFSENQKVFEESKQKQKKLTSTPALTSTSIPAPEQETSADKICRIAFPLSGREENLSSEQSGAAAPTPAGAAVRHKYGTYGWVQLSDGEYTCLLDDLGEEEFLRCVTYLDESAQSNGNKNKWKDWNLVVRRCSREHWGVRGNNGGGRPSASESATGALQQLHQMYASEDYE